MVFGEQIAINYQIFKSVSSIKNEMSSIFKGGFNMSSVSKILHRFNTECKQAVAGESVLYFL